MQNSLINDIKKLYNKKLHVEKAIPLPHACTKLLVVRGDLWCLFSNKIEIRNNANGKLIETLNIDVNQPWGADVVKSGEVVVAATDEGLWLINPETEEVKVIDAGIYYSVQVSEDGEIFTVREDQGKVFLTILESRNKKFIKSQDTQEEFLNSGFGSAHTQTLALIGEDRYVCSWAQHIVYRFSPDGKIIQTYGKKRKFITW